MFAKGKLTTIDERSFKTSMLSASHPPAPRIKQNHQIRYFGTESESFDAALAWAETGDLVVLLDLGRDSDVQTKLKTGA